MTTFKVLIGVDGSKYANEALEWYLNKMHHPGNQVELVYCPEDYIHYDFGMTPQVVDKMNKDMLSTENELQQKYRKRMQEAGVDFSWHVRHTTRPGEAIHEVEKSIGANCIVIGSRGHGKLRRTLIGSVSDFVVHHSHCPVIVCKH